MTDNLNGEMAFKPTLWHRLGFGRCAVGLDDIPGERGDAGFVRSDTFVYWDWRDRFRILFSGKTMCSLILRVDVSGEGRVVAGRSASKVSVLSPRDDGRGGA